MENLCYERITSGLNRPFWLNEPRRDFDSLKKDIECDVVIIGAGIAGLSIGYFLSQTKLSVVIIEDGLIGSGESSRTTAHLTPILSEPYSELIKIFGESSVSEIFASHMSAINEIRKICASATDNCEFVDNLDGYLCLADPRDKDTFEREFHLLKKYNASVEFGRGDTGMLKTQWIKIPGNAQFHPVKFMNHLADTIVKNGGIIYNNTHADLIEPGLIKTSEGYTIKASHIVAASNSPITGKASIHTKQAAYRTLVVAGIIDKSEIQPTLYWDTGNYDETGAQRSYYYVRTTPYNDKEYLLIVGGQDFKAGQYDDEERRYETIREWTRQRFHVKEFVYHWSGQVLNSIDQIAFIGKSEDDIYIATGFCGNGMTFGVLAGMLIRDLILDIPNKWLDLYSPSRMPCKSLIDFGQENMNVAKYYLEWLSSSDQSDISQLKKGEGMVVKRGMKAIAVVRDFDGVLHEYCATCPHLKCIVHWNNDEKSFDCPCHGSRFSGCGKVVMGPANKDLDTKNED